MEKTITLSKLIQTSPQKAYKAFTDEADLSDWFTTNAKCDLKVGGRYSNADHDEGEYLELSPAERVRFTWDNKEHCPGTEVKVEFNSSGENETRVTLTHSGFKDEKGPDDLKTGWTWALTSLKSYLETGKRITYEEWDKASRPE